MTEQEWGKVHLGSIVEYNTINWARLLLEVLFMAVIIISIEQKSQEYVPTRRYVASQMARKSQDGTILMDLG